MIIMRMTVSSVYMDDTVETESIEIYTETCQVGDNVPLYIECTQLDACPPLIIIVRR